MLLGAGPPHGTSTTQTGPIMGQISGGGVVVVVVVVVVFVVFRFVSDFECAQGRRDFDDGNVKYSSFLSS